MKIFNQLGYKVLDIEVDDNSYRHRVIMGEHSLTLYFSLPEHVELPVGSYCEFQGETFTLERPEAFKMKHSRYFEYTVTMEAPEAKAKIWKFRNTVDGRLKFSLTAKPVEHLQMFVDNMNRRDKGWTVGDCIDGVEQCINYDHTFCLDALKQQASEFKTEYEFKGKRVSLKKVEYNKNNPLPLSYGRGNGFKSGVGRTNTGDTPPVEILYVQGGSDNLDPSKYGASELRLPKGKQLGFDGEHFDTEDGFNQDSSRLYITDEDGLSVRRYDKQLASLAEDSLDCSSISPKRVGEVSKVITVDAETNFYDFTDTTIPETLNFEDCLIEGETMTVIFQTGMLAGREFEVKYYHEAKTVRGVKKEARRFELVPQEIDGQTMPNETFKPREGDTYAVFNCMMPDAYICDNKTKTGASWDMFRDAVKYLFDNEDTKLTFTGELDGIWAKKDWLNIGGRIVLGGFIRFTDPRFQPDPVLVRITGIKDYINKPYSPVIELSNTTVSGGVSSTLKELQAQEVLIEDNQRAALQFTKRRFRDARETIAMLEASLLDNFTGSISPIAVQTMSLLVGDESLQFRFVSSRTNPVQVAHAITWDNEQKQLTAEAGIIQHMTLGISSLSSSHDTSEYRFWDVEEYMSGRIEEGEKKFYLYAKVSETGQTGSFLLSETAIKMGQVSGFYHLLVGVLNSEYDGERSFVTLYGFTEVLPGRVTTDRVVSGDGQSYFDMIANALKLGNKLSFNTQGDGLLRLRGTLVQNEGGDESYIGCYRGVWNAAYVYYNGDEVTFTANGLTSTYRYVYATPSRGVVPTNPTYWQILAEGQKGDKGDKGDDGADGIDGVNAYVHIKYAKSLTEGDWSDNNGETPDKYIGIYCDSLPTDSMTWSKYSWSKWKGDDGFGYEYIYKRTTTSSAPSTPTTTSQSDDYVPSGWTDDPSGVNATYKYEWLCYRKKVDGKWGKFIGSAANNAVAALWAKYGTDGADGSDGSDGADAPYYEIRYAKNGSTTSAPSLTKTALNPSGWTTTQPTVTTGYYLWMTIAKKSADGSTLIEQWSTPIRITPYDGTDGKDGKSYAPVMVYRGVYSASKTYYGNENRLDCVKSGDTYYIARIDAGTFSNVAPPNTNKWNSFGASFESVATNLLLAENANIGDWFMSGGKIVSTLSSGDIIELDAKNNRIYIKSATSGGDYAVETGLGSQIELNAATGIIEARSNGSTSAVSYMSPSGIFANRAGTRCVSAITGCDQRAAVCALGFGNLAKDEIIDTGDTNLIAGVYGYASNSSTAAAYGGYFYNLKANGLILGIKKIFGTSTTTTYLTDAQTLVVGLSSVKQNVYLPASDKQGQTIILKQLWTGYMRVYPRSGYKLFDDSTENEYYDVGQGQCLIAHFVKFSINGENVSVWTLSRFKF